VLILLRKILSYYLKKFAKFRGRDFMNKNGKKGIRIVAVLGSVRPNNFTAKALNLVVHEVQKHPHISIEVIDPANLNLSFPGVTPSADSQRIKSTIAEATGVIMATPEYHGTFSSVMKLVIENLGFPSALAGKPVTLLGVASGQIGAIKALEHLRGVCSHVGAIVLPGPISIAGVNKLFDEQGRCLDEKIEKRIRSVATNLIDYIRGYICPKVALEQLVRGEPTTV
jgi:FMN reductase